MPTDDAITAANKVRSRKGPAFSLSHIPVLLVGGWVEFRGRVSRTSLRHSLVINAFPHSVSNARETGEETE